MGERLFSNNATTTLATAINATATALSVTSGGGSLFPTVPAGDSFTFTLVKNGNTAVYEICLCTARSGDTFTAILRGQESTAALSWNAGDTVALLPTAGDLAQMAQFSDLQAQETNYAIDTGSANAYSVGLNPVVTAHVTGMPIRWKAGHTNTGPSTFNDGAGSGALVTRGGSPLGAGQVIANAIYESVWNGSQFELWAVPTYGPTPAETVATYASSPTWNYASFPGNALRFGADPTGTNDSTVPIQNWIDAAWAMYQYQDGQGLWNGSGGAAPVLLLPPGKFRVTGTLYLPSGCTLRGAGHPAHTVNHTRVIMDSSGTNPPGRWTGSTQWLLGDILQPASPNGFWYFCTAPGVGGASAPSWSTTPGTSFSDGAATWECFGATGGTDNRNTPMFKFRRGTLPGVGPGTGAGQGGTLQNAGCCSTIQEMEFWFVAAGATFSNPLGGAGSATGNQRSYPQGATFALDVDCTDMRFIDSVFQNSPCSLWTSGVSNTTATRGDGFPGNRGINIFVENCEFDASSAHLWASGSYLQILFKSCQFYNTPQYVYDCSGKVVYQGCYFQDGEILDYGVGIATGGASPALNAMTALSILGSDIEPPQSYFFLQASGVNTVNISGNSALYASTHGGVYIQGANGGAIMGNAFDSQGANVPAGSSFANFHATIKLDGCSNVLVSGNSISATFSASYEGFGILTGTSTATQSSKNFVHSNSVTAPYTGAAYNGQGRSINLASTADILGTNYDPNQFVVANQGPVANTRITIPYSSSMTFDASAGSSFQINFSDGNPYTLNAPLNPSAGQVIILTLINNSGGGLGTATWNSVFKWAGGLSPSNGSQMSIYLEYQGSWWYERWRSLGNVPN